MTSHHVWMKPLRNNLHTVLDAQKPRETVKPDTCSLIHTHSHFKLGCLLSTNRISHRSCITQSKGRNSHMQAIYIVQPRSLTRSLMFVCLSSFHLNPIKTLFQTNWIFLSCHGCHINAVHQLLGKTVRLQEAFMSPNAKSQEDFWYSIYQSLFFLFPFFGFIIFLYHVFDSLKRKLRLISNFSRRVSSADNHSDLVTFSLQLFDHRL